MSERTRARSIAVCGAGDADEAASAAAAEVGRRIVLAGCTLVCGGLSGVMGAACRAARQARAAGARGLVVGIVPGSDPDGGNPDCDVVVATGMGPGRNLLVVASADAVILIGGGSGTLSEAALAWQLGRPLIALSPSGGWAARLAGQAIDARRPDPIIDARTPEEAVAAALRSLGRDR